MDEYSGCASYQPWPVDDPVQPQSNEDELKNIHWTQHFQLKSDRSDDQDCNIYQESFFYKDQVPYLQRSVMPKPPDACCYGDGWNEEQRHKDEQPEVVSSGHTVAHQHFKHQQQDM